MNRRVAKSQLSSVGLSVFPTPVGMNRTIDYVKLVGQEVTCVPHARGDEPRIKNAADVIDGMSVFPTPVGMNRSTVDRMNPAFSTHVFPTPVGMNRCAS